MHPSSSRPHFRLAFGGAPDCPEMTRFRLKRSTVLPTTVMLLLLLVWELAVRAFDIPIFLLPSPSTIWREMSAVPGRAFDNTMATLGTVLTGFVVSIAFSLPIAVLIVYS